MTQTERRKDEQFCYLTTTGRRTGNPHTVEIWYAREPGGKTIYILSGGGERADWVRNLIRQPRVDVRIGQAVLEGRGRVVGAGSEEERLARRCVVKKYYGRDKVASNGWEATALPVAIDLDVV